MKRSSEQRGHGVSCDQTGLFVGAVPLLEPCRNCAGFQKWRPRPMDELNRDLSNRYGVPVQFDAKLEALAAIARALDRGDLLHAHIATLHLQIPDPPLFANAAQSASEVNALAKQLHASGLLKRGWDPSKHPRWPAGSLDSVGGRFAPADETLGAAPGYESSASTRTAQALPIPFEAVGATIEDRDVHLTNEFERGSRNDVAAIPLRRASERTERANERTNHA